MTEPLSAPEAAALANLRNLLVTFRGYRRNTGGETAKIETAIAVLDADGFEGYLEYLMGKKQ